MQQEPDASSFPNGGIRNTFEAEDIPLGIQHLQHLFMVPLYVFLLFYFVYGEALDNKIPLLRALSADEAATDVCKYFDKNVKKVTATLGGARIFFD
jgi:glutamine synthetase